MMLHSTLPQSPSYLSHRQSHHVDPPSGPGPAQDGVSSVSCDAAEPPRKRKAESQDNNERLSKRLSLLNLEKPNAQLCVPVENIRAAGENDRLAAQVHARSPSSLGQDSMQLDDSKYKVYIHNLDDELSSDDDDAAGGGAEDGRLVFLPDIEKHLRRTRIPPHVLANSEGELAGMQMVLYSDPTSLTLPKEQDSVRKAIIEARQRLRSRQSQEPGSGLGSGPGTAEPLPTPQLHQQAPADPGLATGQDDEVMDID